MLNHATLNLKSILRSIATLDDKAKGFREECIKVSRQAILYAISPEGSGNAEPISQMYLMLINIGHKGLQSKFRHWVEDCSPFKLKADTVATFNKRKDAPLQVRNDVVFKTDFVNYQREAPKKADWSLDAAIREAMQRAMKRDKLTETQVRLMAENAVKGQALKVIKAKGSDHEADAVKEKVLADHVPLTNTFDVEANDKAAA